MTKKLNTVVNLRKFKKFIILKTLSLQIAPVVSNVKFHATVVDKHDDHNTHMARLDTYIIELLKYDYSLL